MSNRCVVDGAEIPDNGTICWDDANNLAEQLRDAHLLLGQLQELAHPAMGVRHDVGYSTGTFKSRPPIRDFDALDRAHRIQENVLSWAGELARHTNGVNALLEAIDLGRPGIWFAENIGRFRMQDAELTKNAYGELVYVFERGRRLVKSRHSQPRRPIGYCDTYVQDAKAPAGTLSMILCDGVVYVDEGAATADCRRCGATYDAVQTKMRSLRQLEDHLHTADAIVRMFGMSMPVTLVQISRWKSKGVLVTRGVVTVRGQACDLLRIGDVIDLWLERNSARSSTPPTESTGETSDIYPEVDKSMA